MICIIGSASYHFEFFNSN
uniref:Uncharacterized protein n=1 Tax=Anguilla anguilla TaxID=7936 RepID=A0A0E9XZH5_ANGAN